MRSVEMTVKLEYPGSPLLLSVGKSLDFFFGTPINP